LYLLIPKRGIAEKISRHAKDTVAALSLINDYAKRAVKLATDFNLALTHDEQQHQLIFQVIEQHRKQMPTAPPKKIFPLQ